MQIDEEIHLEQYNPEWAHWYEVERAKILIAAGDIYIIIEHFGSTSIPGMMAKPIVDILMGVNQLPVKEGLLNVLTELEYESFGEISPGRLYLRKRGKRAFNIAIVEYGSEIWLNNIVLRNYLRLKPEEAQKYSDVKLNAYSEGCRTLLTYSDYKGSFVSEMLARAKKWAGTEIKL